MNSDEAIAVYLYLKDRPPGQTTQREIFAYNIAWQTICGMAQQAIKEIGENQQLKREG